MILRGKNFKISKDFLLSLSPVYQAWGLYRENQLLREYRQRRNRYYQDAIARKSSYDENRVISEANERIENRGWKVQRKKFGQVNTFAFIPLVGWHGTLLPALHKLGNLYHYDFIADGFEVSQFQPSNSNAAKFRKKMNERAFFQLKKAHEQHGIDWVFVYAAGKTVGTSFLQRITDELGIPLISMCLDDKQSWQGPIVGDQHVGQVDIAPFFDLSWTSARVACLWYSLEGGRAIYLPEGFEPTTIPQLTFEKDIPLSFIGAAYGFRRKVISHLSKNNTKVVTFGAGWKTRSLSSRDFFEVLARSQLNLGMGGIGYSEMLTNVKGRDFEVPSTGQCLYITSYNSDLANHFVVGKEIVCYRHLDELVELVNYYLNNSVERQEIIQHAKERAYKEHTWLHRYATILQALNILDQNIGPRDLSELYHARNS